MYRIQHATYLTLFFMIISMSNGFCFDLVVDGKPAATIIIPKKPEKMAGDAFILENSYWRMYYASAFSLREHIEAITGARLRIEYDKPGVRGNCILLGPSSYRKKLNLPDEIKEAYGKDLKDHMAAIRVVGNSLVLKDIRNNIVNDGKASYLFYPHSVPILLEEVFGVRWFATGSLGRELPPRTLNLKVDDKLVIRKKPSVDFYGYLGPKNYHKYNHSGHHGYKKMKQWGGHSWGYNVPPRKYFNKKEHPESYHPEYYSLDKKGKRNPHRGHGSLCTSNPEVLKIAVEYYRNMFDKGYDAVELGQPDGYGDRRSCHCEKCMAYSDTSQEGLGKRIWKFHLAIADEVAKSHPDKYLIFLLYGPNKKIPDFVPSPLPSNIVLQVATSSGLDRLPVVDKYKPTTVTIYTYEFTSYNVLGMNGPKSSVEKIKRIFKNCKKYNIRGIYWCGQAWSNFGMEGPQYWLAQRMQWNWNEDPDKLMREYWDRFYKSAAKPMEDFYNAIYEKKRSAIAKLKKQYGSALNGQKYAPFIFQSIFDVDLTRKANELLAQAKRLASGNNILLRRINAVEESFMFNLVTRDCFVGRAAFEQDKTFQKLQKWRDALAVRNGFIENWETRYSKGEFRDSYCPGLPSTAFTCKSVMDGVFRRGPFNVGTKNLVSSLSRQIKGHEPKRNKMTMVANKPDAGYWSKNINATTHFVLDENGEKSDVRTDVLMCWDMKNIYFRFRCHEPTDTLISKCVIGSDDDITKTDSVEIVMVPPKENGSKYYRFGVNVEGTKRTARFGFMRSEFDPNPSSIDLSWNPEWSAKIIKSEIPGVWTADITIPWKSIGGMSKGGMYLRLNLNFVRNRPARSEKENNKTYAWNASFGNVTTYWRFGTLDFYYKKNKRYIVPKALNHE